MITVIMPVYNRVDDIRQALHSLCGQTTHNFKLLVSDDHSTEDTKSVCDEFGDQLDIEYIRAHKNLGCGGNRNFALTHFLQNPTEYVMFMDSDDALMPQAIERLLSVLKYNSADIVVSNILQEVSVPDGMYTKIIEAEKSRTWLHGKAYRSAFLKENNINFTPDLRTNEDLAFNLSAYAYNPQSYIINEELYLWRDNQNSITRSKNETINQQKCSSIDYIEAIYRGFMCYGEQELPRLMINSILNCYMFYQNGLLFELIKERHNILLKKMLHKPEVAETIVSIYKRPDITIAAKQWVVKGETLYFYKETFGQWLMRFFTIDEIKQTIAKYNAKS